MYYFLDVHNIIPKLFDITNTNEISSASISKSKVSQAHWVPLIVPFNLKGPKSQI
jgi:hypothetical protein